MREVLHRQAGVMGTQVFPHQATTTTTRVTTPSVLLRSFSAAIDPAAVVTQKPGYVSKKLRVLNMDTVKNILTELNAVDVNSDGR
jgi:hypothetical protein